MGLAQLVERSIWGREEANRNRWFESSSPYIFWSSGGMADTADLESAANYSMRVRVSP